MSSSATSLDGGGELRFGFDFDPRFVVPARFFGVTPNRAVVVVHDEGLSARFGPWSLETGLDNILSATVTGPYHLIKVLGPARLSAADRGLTFATTTRRGVQINFHHPVGGIEPTHLLKHPNLTVTVTDCEGLIARLIARRGTPSTTID